MAEQHVKFLQGIGVDQTIVDNLEKLEGDAAKGYDPKTDVEAVTNATKNKYLNDDEFLKSIPENKISPDILKKVESGQLTRFQNEMKELAMKELGFEEKDFEDLKPKEKESVIKATARFITSKHLEKKGNVQGLKDMQTQVQQLTEKLEAKDADWQEKSKQELEKVNGVASARIIKNVTKAVLATLPGVKLTVPPAYITEQLLSRLQNNYTLVLDDNDDVQLRQKANKELKVLDGSKEVTFEDALKKQILSDKLGEEVKADDKDDPKKKKKVVIGEGEEGDDNTFTAPDYISSKIKKNVDLEK